MGSVFVEGTLFAVVSKAIRKPPLLGVCSFAANMCINFNGRTTSLQHLVDINSP